MASSKRPPPVPEDLAPDPELTYNPARSVLPSLPTALPTEPAIPVTAGSSPGTAARITGPPEGEGKGEVFELREKLAQGGFGDVWSGIQPALGRVVALKRLREDRLAAAGDEDRRLLQEMFRQEALITARLEHPNVVPVYQLGADDTGRPMLAMKLVRGRPWSELIRDDLQLPADELLARHLPILIDVAQAVAYAHSRGILHRDLKPQQVMVGEFGEVLLIDWGLALPFDQAGAAMPAIADSGTPESSGTATAVTACPGLAGTPSFMAPEQTRGVVEEIGPWTDLYLLAGTLYCLLTGSPPHKARSSVAAFVKASSGKIEPPAERAPNRHIPEELRRLALGALAAAPTDRRPATVRDFITALEEYQSGVSRKRRSRELALEVRGRSAGGDDYSELGHRLSRLQQAQVLWPENPEVAELRQGVLASYAETALAHKDLALARLQAGQLTAGTGRDDLLERIDRSLERRRAVARQRRLALAALALLAAVLIGGAFLTARDQRLAAERLAAERDAAREARADATGLMTFMLEDLWERLRRIERVDLLTPVARRADDYYSERDPATLQVAERVNRGAAFSTIGQALQYQGDVEGAVAAHGKAATVFRELTAEEPENPDHLLRYLDALHDLGFAQSDLGDKEAALETLREHRRRCEAALAGRPGDVELEEALLTGIDSAGIVLYDLGELEPAGAVFATALALAEKIRRGPPAVELSDLTSGIYMRLAVTQSETGQLEQALASIDRSIALAEEAWRLDPLQSRAGIAFAGGVRARILFDLGRRDEAAEILRAGRPELRHLVDEDPANAERRYSLANLELELGNVESELGNRAAAEAAWQRVVDTVEPLRETTDHSYLLDNLVRALLYLGRVEEARPIAAGLLAKGWSHQGFLDLCRRYGLEEAE